MSNGDYKAIRESVDIQMKREKKVRRELTKRLGLKYAEQTGLKTRVAHRVTIYGGPYAGAYSRFELYIPVNVPILRRMVSLGKRLTAIPYWTALDWPPVVVYDPIMLNIMLNEGLDREYSLERHF